MSSLRNAVKRREHKERAQPENRQRFGLLEKKKDYRQRADDFNKKQKAIKHLRGKAEERNPDEFYFGMERSSTKDGVHMVRSSEANKYTQEQLALMRTQDIAYFRNKTQAESAKSEKLKSTLHFLGAAGPSNHTIFVADDEEAKTFDASAYFDTPAELLDRSYNRPKNAQLEDALLARSTASKQSRKLARKVHAKYHELAQRARRKDTVHSLLKSMELKQALASNGRKRKLSPSESDGLTRVYKWKRERKK